MSDRRYEADLARATRLARAAATAIVEVTEEARRVPSQKADHSPVTAADLAADRVIRAGLADTGDVVVTEETWDDRPLPATGRVWIVDPLDGTSDFIAGRDDYVVQVALVDDGVARVGVLCHPPTGTVWRGISDGAASMCERIDDTRTTALRLLPTTPLPQRPPLITPPSWSTRAARGQATTMRSGAAIGLDSVRSKAFHSNDSVRDTVEECRNNSNDTVCVTAEECRNSSQRYGVRYKCKALQFVSTIR